MPYVIQVDAIALAGNMFTAGCYNAVGPTAALSEAAAAQTFTATKPTLLFINPAGSGYNCYLTNLELFQTGTVAGARPNIMMAYDSGNRYSSGAAARYPVNKMAGGRTSAVSLYQGQNASLVTATAATAFVKYFTGRDFLQTVTAVNEIAAQTFDFCGSVVIPPGFTFLVYLIANTTGMTYAWNLDWFERNP